MTTDTERTIEVHLTVAHHADNEFYDLGEIVHEVTPQQIWDALIVDPATECCRAEDSGHDLCWLIDQYVTGGLSDSREVTAARAAELLGRDPWTELEQARADLQAVYRQEVLRHA